MLVSQTNNQTIKRNSYHPVPYGTIPKRKKNVSIYR